MTSEKIAQSLQKSYLADLETMVLVHQVAVGIGYARRWWKGMFYVLWVVCQQPNPRHDEMVFTFRGRLAIVLIDMSEPANTLTVVQNRGLRNTDGGPICAAGMLFLSFEDRTKSSSQRHIIRSPNNLPSPHPSPSLPN